MLSERLNEARNETRLELEEGNSDPSRCLKFARKKERKQS